MEHGISFWREGSEIHRESVWEAPRAFVWEDHLAHTFRDQGFWWECSVLVFCVSPEQISSLCAEEAAAQEQTGQVEECLKVNLLKIKTGNDLEEKIHSLDFLKGRKVLYKPLIF